MVHREPEWTDDERDKMLDLAAYEAEVHETCGLHDSVAKTDPDLQVVTDVCPICAGIELNMRVIGETDRQIRKGMGDPPPAHEPDPADGRRISLRANVPTDTRGG